jgi:uncharacterized integral membrane protein (TIGR00698 family)
MSNRQPLFRIARGFGVGDPQREPLKGTRRDEALFVADLYGDAAPQPASKLFDYVPGLVVTGLATLAAAYLSQYYGAPVVLMALLVGLALNFLRVDKRLTSGLALASRTLLRFAIVLLGTRVTVGDAADLGVFALASLTLVIVASIVAAVLTARWLRFSAASGVLAGGAVALCGASAALALYAALGERRVNQAELTLVLVGVSAMSSLAMILYPLAAHYLGLTDRQAGFVLGASIHDVAQVLGAGYSYSQAAGETATVVKLTRVALLAPVLAVVGCLFPSQEGKRIKSLGIPWFVAGFFLVAAINSAGLIPPVAADGGRVVAPALLACAVTATGIQSPMQKLLGAGWRPLLPVATATIVAFGVALLLGLSAVA